MRIPGLRRSSFPYILVLVIIDRRKGAPKTNQAPQTRYAVDSYPQDHAPLTDRSNTILAGCCPSNIRSVLAENPELITHYPAILITCIDSQPDLWSTTTFNQMRPRESDLLRLGNGAMVPGHRLAQLGRIYNLFNGFDELWCFHQAPATPKPDALTIVSPPELGPDNVPPLLFPWMRASACILALGDGTTLNFATTQPMIARWLREHLT